jgi:hypothetical protein
MNTKNKENTTREKEKNEKGSYFWNILEFCIQAHVVLPLS